MFTLVSSLKIDLFHNFRALLFLGVSNILPETVFFSYLRPILWKFAGVNVSFISFCSIKKNVFLENPRGLTLGKYININRGVIIAAHGNITIEDNVSLAFNSSIITVSHSGLKHEVDVYEPVCIKTGCHIGTNAVILPGAVLNEYSIISPGCIFSGEALNRHIYVGNPARKIKERDDI